MKNHLYLLLTCIISIVIISCGSENTSPPPEIDSFIYDEIVPAPFPVLDIPGFNFPEDSITLNDWIYNDDFANIYTHAWGIWAGLTYPTKQSSGGQNLLTYETWQTPEEMINIINNSATKRSNRANLKRPHQLTHFNANPVDINIHESVSYSPSAAKHAISNKLFMATTLYDYFQKGMTEIPVFPNDAITIKPVFKLIKAKSSAPETKFPIATWHGTIDTLSAFGEKQWQTCIYVDITNSSNGDGSQLPCPDILNPPPATAATSYNLNDFIHFTLNAEDVHFFNKEFSENSGNKFNAQVGDFAILVGMHVTTRENKRWTWQSYWWAPDANNPPLPSSKQIADMRPKALVGPASHYAMTVAYYMINPQEPYVGTNITGEPNYAFNPYLEAGFGQGVFQGSNSVINTPDGAQIETNVGVRTNCMSCHVYATVNLDSLISKASSPTQTPYSGNAYVSLDDPIFTNQLKMDFAWSVEGNVDTTGLSNYIANYPQ